MDNKNAPRISVVIPAFNAENYIKDSIESIISQPYKDWELIVVDDGSSDNTVSIVGKYCEKNSSIRLIVQENLGAGVARNNGLEKASGEYVLFLDADDLLDKNSFFVIDNNLKSNADVLIFDGYDFFGNIEEATFGHKLSFAGENGVYLSTDLSCQIFQLVAPYPPTKVFRREFIINEGIRFQETKRVNDLFFSYASIATSKKLYISNEKIAYYRKDVVGSLSDKRGKWDGMISAALTKLKSFLEEKGLYSLYRDSFEKLVIESGVWEMSRTGNKESFVDYIKYYYGKLLNDLNISVEKNSRLLDFVKSGEELIIYGAGDVAEVFTNLLIWVCGVEKNKISVVVSKVGDKRSRICGGIEVKEISEINREKKCNTVVIAVENKETRNTMKEYAINLGYDDIIEAGYYEIGLLIRKLIINDKK